MYSTCLFCHGALGANPLIESFPVGRRLAFDGARGRLWVICTKCGQWNLTPLEERWEAVEDCERHYRTARRRVTTDQIGLARVAGELDLIQIGRPLRPEFAAWRYGERFRQRRRRHRLVRGITLAAFIGGAATGYLPAGSAWLLYTMAYGWLMRRSERQTEVGAARRFIAWTVAERTGAQLPADQAGFVETRLISTADEQGWGIRLGSQPDAIDITGADALQAAHLLLPASNGFGASLRDVDRAIRAIEDVGDPSRFFSHALERVRRRGDVYSSIVAYEPVVRLGLEMAAHEETERRAMDGELQRLEAAWRAAEEIARIADDLLVPEAVHDRIRLARSEKGASASPVKPECG
ncbi:MAG TPA: hypothetical protein VHQ45_03730 [Gemmatimonadaceae bacterium]|nr:hypothetical protein [Gemmatimonadaceae bacterium]